MQTSLNRNFGFTKKYAFKKSGLREKLTMVYLLNFLPFSKFKSQVCTVELDVRELEQRSMKLIPNVVLMKSETVLTQYIITGWVLVYKNQSKVILQKGNLYINVKQLIFTSPTLSEFRVLSEYEM